MLALQGRNRRCLTLDLRQEAGRDICRQLADRADVLVENFRPGVMEKWGLGPKVGAQALLLNAHNSIPMTSKVGAGHCLQLNRLVVRQRHSLAQMVAVSSSQEDK